MTSLEIIAMISTLLCVWLTAKQKIVAWPVGIVGVIAFFILFIDQKFYFQASLQVIFFMQSVYGWISWQKSLNQNDFTPKKIQNVKFATEYLLVFTISLIGGYIMGVYLDTTLPYMDGISTGFSILATYYLAKHYIEAWLVWMGVNITLFIMTIHQQLYIIAVMELVLFLISLKAYISWKKDIKTVSA